jgi:hypothetical protein
MRLAFRMEKEGHASGPSALYVSGKSWSAISVSRAVQISGTHPFKAIVRELSPQYTMYWQVDGDRLNPLANNYEEYPHKEVLVDLGGWKWRGDGPYAVNFVVRDANGNNIAERRVDIYFTH